MMVNVNDMMVEKMKEVFENAGRISSVIWEVYDEIILEGADSLESYLNGYLTIEEAEYNSELMGAKLDWLDENLENIILKWKEEKN